MKRIILGLCMAASIAFAATVAQAQISCPIDPATGNPAAAQIISPTPGSTLQADGAGFVTFTWCNASADYFVIIETGAGFHDIFFAFTGGAGGGAGQNFLSLPLVPSLPNALCATTPPFGCIPAQGETIFFTLDTVKNKQLLGSFQYTFTAPSPPAPPAASTTAVDNKSATASAADQTVTLTASVTAASTVNQGTVTFQVMNGLTNVGAAVTSAPLTNGLASVIYALPGGTAAQDYTIQASYSGGANFTASSGTGTLTVNAAPAIQEPTTTTASDQSVTFSAAVQNVTLSATVTAASAVNEGTVSFQVKDGANHVGSAVTSGALVGGKGSVIYALPAGLLAGSYTIQATYSGGTNFLASSGNGNLTVSPTPPAALTATTTTVGNAATTFSGSVQHVTLSAAVSVPGGGSIVNQGTVTFQVMDGATDVGAAVPSTPLTNGLASVSYALPAGQSAKAYTVQATYSGGPTFASSSGSGTLDIAKAPSTTSFTSAAPASLPFNGTYTPAATSTGDGTLTIGASGSCSITGGVVKMTAGSGTCTVTATESEGPNFLGSAATPQSFTATKANAVVTVNNVTVAFDGLPHSATATTIPSGLTVNFTYNGSTTPPTQAGIYAVVGTINDPNFQGSGNGTLTITTSIRALEAQVASLSLNGGNKKSLMSKLQAAQASMDRKHGGAAAKQLGAFVNEVRALQRSGRLDSATAASLIAQATFIITSTGSKEGRERDLGDKAHR